LRQLWHYARVRDIDAAVEKDTCCIREGHILQSRRTHAAVDSSNEAVKDEPRDSWGTLQDQIEKQAYDKVHAI